MASTFNYDNARIVLEEACMRAESKELLSIEWHRTTALIAACRVKTYTPMLGTGLLARATDDTIDALSIKADSGEHAYSARSLCHQVLVPESVRRGFDLRARGREPLNNQPFFRYDRVDRIVRVKYPTDFRMLLDALRHVGTLDKVDAREGLAAFVRQRLEAAHSVSHPTVDSSGIDFRRLIHDCSLFLAEDAEGGKRAQAIVAAALDVGYGDVRARRVNDPSRDIPGDVHVFSEGLPIVAVEVRAKPVPMTEILQFAEAVAKAGIPRALVVVLAAGQVAIDEKELWVEAWERNGVVVGLVGSVEDLLLQVFQWADVALPQGIERFCESGMTRLVEIEAAEESLQSWVAVCEGTPR